MKCRQVRNHLVELFDAAPNPDLQSEVIAHLTICPACKQEYEEMAETQEALRPRRQVFASPDFKERVMNRVAESNTGTSAALASVRNRVLRPLVAAGLAVLLFVAASYGVWRIRNGGERPLTAFTVLGQAAHAMANLQSVHIQARMRTLPRDNFELILLDGEFVDHDLWKDFTEPQRWRVEKDGRVVVMDGEESVLWMKPGRAAKGGRRTGFVQWLLPLLDVDQVLESELARAQLQGSNVSLVDETGPDGAPELVLYVEAAAQGDFTNDWCLNKSVTESDNLRVYRLDAETMYLKALQVFVHTDAGEDVLVFETTAIEYDVAIDPALFTLELPEDVSWYEAPKPLANNAAYAAMTPKQVARAFLEACAEENWEEAEKFHPVSPLPEFTKEHLSGVKIVELGTPFQSGLYSGWFIPYEIKLKTGEVWKHNVAVRNDNPAGRYIIDGGL